MYYKSFTPPTVDYNMSVTDIKQYKVLHHHMTFWRTIIHLQQRVKGTMLEWCNLI